MNSQLSEAARIRALRRGPGALGFLVAHHWASGLDRCYLSWLGRRPVWWCARCVGMYPALALILTIQLLAGVPAGWWDVPWLFLLPVPAFVDWARSRLGDHAGSNRFRTLTGSFLGISLARTVYLNMLEPARPVVVLQLAILVTVAILVEVGRFARRRREAEP